MKYTITCRNNQPVELHADNWVASDGGITFLDKNATKIGYFNQSEVLHVIGKASSA